MSVAKRLHKVLIANRGEIACRVVRTARRLGVKTVGIYSDVDADSMHASVVDEAFNIGRPPAQESYLRGEKIIEVAKKCDARAIHPGYGFLSENAEFAELCQQNGIVFIGPPPSAIRDMGIKSTSKAIMSDAGVPVIPGYHGNDQSEATLLKEAEKIGYPLMIKAVRGGGGKGMRIAMTEEDFLPQLESAKREALKSFGDDNVLLERYVSRPRHVEVQVFGDTHGNYVYLYERDCSVQRRHQKVIEQAPAPGVSEELRRELGEAGVRAARAVGYVGAGTVEFILDTNTNKFFFMEMNTRLQVEHPVTEMITGVDLVEWQLAVAAGEKLPLEQKDIPLRGCALEARIYAEDVHGGFVPAPGRVCALGLPTPGPDIRIESGIREGDDVSVHYDPMIAKLVVWDPDTEGAFDKLDRSLSDFNIVGVENNVDFLRKLCRHRDLIEGNVHTGFIEEHRSVLLPESAPTNLLLQAAVGVVLRDEVSSKETIRRRNDPFSPFGSETLFRLNGQRSRTVKLKYKEEEVAVTVVLGENNKISVHSDLGKLEGTASLSPSNGQFYSLTFHSATSTHRSAISFSDNALYFFSKDENGKVEVLPETSLGESAASGQKFAAVSPMPGVVEKVYVKPGDTLRPGDAIAVVIAMKMEHVIKSDRDGKIQAVLYKQGDSIGKNQAIVKFEE